MNYRSQLNPEQIEATEYTEGPLLILAGAGSGKTRVLMYRIVSLLDKGVEPERILAITFTNKAAREMRERAQSLIGSAVSRMWIATFHAACARILRREIEVFGFTRAFTIIDTNDAERHYKNIVSEIGLDKKIYAPGVLGAAIDKAKNSMQTPEEFRDAATDVFNRNVARVYIMYQRILKQNNCLDFNDIINYCVRLFENYPDVLRYYQEKFQYIMVDEYQDTNHSQYRLVTLLAKGHRRICVVGDEDQGIYTWRGADITNILSFSKEYPDAKIIKLERNYRSTQPILNAAWHVIQNNSERLDKRLWSEKQSNEMVILQSLDNEHAEAQAVITEIQRLRTERNLAYSDFAVLYRVHSQSRQLEEKLLQQQIPYTIFGGIRFFERREIKDIIAYLRVLVNPYDDQSLRRIINVPRRGIGLTTLQHLDAFAQQMELPLYACLEMVDEIPGFSPRTKSKIAEFSQLLSNFRQQMDFLPVKDLLNEIVERSGYHLELENSGKEEDQDRIANLQELINVASEFDVREEESNEEENALMTFLSNVSLLTNSDVSDAETRDLVYLMTLHSAKGLEFPVVFIVGMEEGVFPHFRSLEDPKQVEEERRLCYVGMTRAKDLLYLSRSGSRMLYGVTQSSLASRFIDEIPKEYLLDRSRPSQKQMLQATTWQGSPPPSQFYQSVRPKRGEDDLRPSRSSEVKNEPIGNFTVGDLVQHNTLGRGTLLSLVGQGENQIAAILFEDGSKKTFLLKYAKIERVQE